MRPQILWVLLTVVAINSCTGQGLQHQAPTKAEAIDGIPDSCYAVQDIFTGFSAPGKAVIISVPAVVKEKISAALRQLIAHEIPSDTDEAAADQRASLRLMLMRLPVSGRIAAYVLHVAMMGPVNRYFVYLYNDDGAVSRTPFSYWGGEMQADEVGSGSISLPETLPNFSTADIDGDGRPEIRLRERRHNGNIYDASVIHMLGYDSNLQFKASLPLETWATAPFDTSDRRIHRSLRYDAASREYIVSAILTDGGKEEPLGTVRLRQMAGGWQIGKRTVLVKSYARLLITCSPTRKEAAFLNEGYGE